MNNILFSCIGDTDPVLNGYDGPMLHIVRNYKPQKVYLFYTERYLEVDKTYNYYESEILRICPECDVVKLKDKTDIIAYDFDTDFQKYCQNILFKIVNENHCRNEKENTLLVNVTSGTMQMITAICMAITGLPKRYNIKPVQVINPIYKTAPLRIADINNNIDNSENFVSRTALPKFININSEFSKKHLITLLSNYEYEIALEFFINEFYSSETNEQLDKIKCILESLAFRKGLEIKKVNKLDVVLKEKYNIEMEFPISITDSKIKTLLEYVTVLKLYCNKYNVHGFFMIYSVIFAQLTAIYINEKFGVELFEDSSKNREYLRTHCPEVYAKMPLKEKYTFTSSYMSRLLNLLQENKKKERIIFNSFNKAREIEMDIRNRLAHSMPDSLVGLFSETSLTEAMSFLLSYAINVLRIKNRWNPLVNINILNKSVINEIKKL